VVDQGKCQGCLTCMLAWSLANHGRENLSLARIQVLQDSYASYPDDVRISQCRQCVEPKCLEACPKPGRALYVDAEHGNVRAINPAECVGCRECIDACPFPPGRTVWNHEDDKAEKCDLCSKAPHWKEAGGPADKQACVEMCPVKAIALVHEVPPQSGDGGYDVNLRGRAWKKLGFTTD
jgi:protein NrfC